MTKDKPTKPISVYVRVSRVGAREGESYISPAEQEERCKAYLRAHGLSAGTTFMDEDQSGRTMHRPGFEGAMEAVRQGSSGGIIVARLNRLARNTISTIRTIAEVEDADGTFLSVDPPVDTSTPNGRFMLTIFAALAELESETIRANWSTAQAYARARGVHISPRVPFGYRRNEDGTLGKTEGADLVRVVYEMRGRGDGFQVCADFLNSSGARTPTVGDGSGKSGGGNEWSEGATRKLVQNPIYKGEPSGGEEMPQEVRDELRVVSNRVWKLAQPKADGRRQRKEEHLLSGLCRCGSCGGTLTASVNRKPRKDGSVHAASHYTCRQRAVGAKKCKKPVTVSGAILEPYVLDLLVNSGKWTGTAITGTDDADDLREAVADALHDVQEVEALRTTIRPAAYAQALSDAQETVERAQEALDRLGEQNIEKPLPAELARRVVEEAMTTAQRRDAIRSVLGPVTIAPRSSRVQPIGERVTLDA